MPLEIIVAAVGFFLKKNYIDIKNLSETMIRDQLVLSHSAKKARCIYFLITPSISSAAKH